MSPIKDVLRLSYARFSTVSEVVLTLPWSALVVVAAVPVLGILTAYLITHGRELIAVIIVAAIPIGLLLVRRPFTALLLWLLIAPFFVVTPNSATRMGYWVLHRALLPLAGIILLFSHLSRRRLHLDLVDIALLGYILVNVFSVLYYYPGDPLLNLYHVFDSVVVGAVLFWFIRAISPDKQQLEQVLIVLIVLSLLQGIIGLMMNLPFTRGLLPSFWYDATEARTSGTLKRPAEFSSTVAASLLLLAHYVFYVQRRLLKGLILVSMLLGCLAIVFTFSRSSWLAAAVAGAFLFLFYARLRPYFLIVGFVLVTVLSASLFADPLSFASERLGYQRTIDARIISNYAHLRMISMKPLLGWGFDNYTRYHMQFVTSVGDVAVRDPDISSHNTFLSITVELGLVGLALYLSVWLALLARSFTCYKRMPSAGLYSRKLLLLLWLGVLFWFIVSNSMNMRVTSWGSTWVWLLLGLIASIVDRYHPSLASGNVGEAPGLGSRRL
jgi:hypothetical protein